MNMVGTKQNIPSWTSAAATRVDFEGNPTSAMPEMVYKEGKEDSLVEQQHHHHHPKPISDANLNFVERVLSAAGASVLSAILVNPLDIAKTRLQAQAAGVPYQGLCCNAPFETNTMLLDIKSSTLRMHSIVGPEPPCQPGCNQYKGTLDVLYKVIRQEGFSRLWRGTNASLVLAVPTVGIYLPCYDICRDLMEDIATNKAPAFTPYVPLLAGSLARSLACVTCYPVELARTRMQAFSEAKTGAKPPGVCKTLLGVINPMTSTNHIQNSLQRYRVLWTGLGAQLARDVPFSAICWSTLEPIRRSIIGLIGSEASAANILEANFSAGFIAGSLAAATTCPFDVARTRRQIEKDPARALSMTTRTTLAEIWRDGGIRGLFTGIGPRVARTGPSVGIVVSSYEVVKYAFAS